MKSLISTLLRHSKSIFLGLVILDASIVLLHLILGRSHPTFNLDLEQNLPTFYQSAKLLLFGVFFLVLGLHKNVQLGIKSFILPLGLFLTFLGLDELLQIHENIYRIFELFDGLHPQRVVETSMKLGYRSSLWLLYYLPFIVIFVFWSGYWLRYFQSRMKSNMGIIALSSLCLFAVLLAEILSSTGVYSDSGYFLLVTIEETAEMLLASALVFVGLKMLNTYLPFTSNTSE